jgi:hypothetical protein
MVVNPRHAFGLLLLAWCLSFLPKSPADMDTGSNQSVCFDSYEQCILAKKWLVVSWAEQWAGNDIRALPPYIQQLSCFQFDDLTHTPDF